MRECVHGETDARSDDENAKSVLWNTEVGGVQETPDNVIFRLVANGTLVASEPLVMALPELTWPSRHRRAFELAEHVLEISLKSASDEAPDVFKEDCFWSKQADHVEDYWEEVPSITLGEVVAREAERLAGHGRRK